MERVAMAAAPPQSRGHATDRVVLTEGSCSLTCGGGTKTLTYRRLCNSPAPQYGGTNCTGNYFKNETLVCNIQPCPIDGSWSSWQWLDNGTCSVMCGEGLMEVTYTRECDSPAPQYNGSNCLGNNTKTEIVICDYQSCPVDGSWSSWQWLDNGTCSVTCGEGLMEVTYTRECDSPAPQYNGSNCLGDNTKTETVICDYQSCPVSDNSSSWYLLDNGTCSVTCGGGEMTVTYRQDCDSAISQGDAGNCTENSTKSETTDCNTQPCPVDGSWSSWQWLDNGTCSVTCGEGLMEVTYTRECDSPSPQYNGSNCLGDNTKTEIVICDSQSCPGEQVINRWASNLQFRTTLWRRDLRKDTSPGHKLQSAARSLLRVGQTVG
ncbi:hypothetical protein C0Q70_18411 [Pomacea canaliculata]|uniref:Uncharacterized protein n=1 Tax=Pomacea canaliculata TaxID=400727 RepID=A0A2T7NN58_POMCA|nr:hypothetical protein C0Q70_18411 [Pomacea canaliculata]